jgi:integrase
MPSRRKPNRPIRFTDLTVQNWKRQGEFSDAVQRGLRLVGNKTGTTSWIYRYRHPLKRKSAKMTLPPGVGLAQARKIVADAAFLVAQGIDPIDQKRVEREAAAAAVEGTLASVATRYLDLAAPKRSRMQYERTLKNHILPKLGDSLVTEIKRSEIVAVLDVVEQKSGARASDKALAVLSAALHWYEKRSDSFRSPLIRGMWRVRPSERARDRKLDDDEIRRLWGAAGDARIGTYGQVIRFMILTGARRNEAAGLRRKPEIGIDDETGLTVWRLPASRSKNKREVVRPLSRAALAIIEDAPIIGGDNTGYVFTFDGNRPMNMSYQNRKELFDEIAGVDNWVLHDLRRVFRSLLSRVRTPFEIAEALLGHSRPLLVRTYDQHHPLVEMLEAVERVAAEIERIVSGEREGRVVRLRP